MEHSRRLILTSPCNLFQAFTVRSDDEAWIELTRIGDGAVVWASGHWDLKDGTDAEMQTIFEAAREAAMIIASSENN